VREKNRQLLYGLILGFLLSLLLAPKSPLAFVLAALVATGIALFVFLYNSDPPRSEREEEEVLLKSVRESWVASLTAIEALAPNAQLLDLHYEATTKSWDEKQDLDLVKEFETSGRSLLILGPEASGKTVSALILVRYLVERSVKYWQEPIPVFLSLQSWNYGYKEKEFIEWLVDELKRKYDVADTSSRRWLLGKRLLLVLDGLDEVFDRDLCVEKLTEFISKRRPPGIIVTSRNDDRRLPILGLAIRIAQLSAQQIDVYSKNFAPPADDETVSKFSTSPLTLMLMLLLGKEMPKDLGARDELIRVFINTQMKRAESDFTYGRKRILQALRWLAQAMDRHREVIFYIDALQPSWLPPQPVWRRPPVFIRRLVGKSRRFRRLLMGDRNQLVYVIVSRVIATFIVMMLGWLEMIAFSRGLSYYLGVKQVSFGVNFVNETPFGWLLITIFMGGLLMTAFDYGRFRISERLTSNVAATLSKREGRRNFFLSIISCLVVFTFFGGWVYGFLGALRGATVYAIAFGAVFWIRGDMSASSDIRTADKLKLTRNWYKGLIPGAIAGAALGAFLAVVVRFTVPIIVGTQADSSNPVTVFWLSIIIGTIVGAVTRGLDKVSVIEKSYPNQGVWLSLRNTGLIWLVVWFSSSAVIWIYAIYQIRQVTATFQDCLFYGCVIGMLVSCGYGGLDVIYHVTIRFLLYWKGLAPFRRYAPFLNDMTVLFFLKKAGSGYTFQHGSVRSEFTAFPEDYSAAPSTPLTQPKTEVA
jgi:hypothetical protein